MANRTINKFTQYVEIACKTLWKTWRKSSAKFCAKLLLTSSHSVKLYFPTHFSHLSHHFSRTHLSPGAKLSYPHFHRPYYNNY